MKLTFKHIVILFAAIMLSFGITGCKKGASSQDRQTELVNEISTTPILYTVTASAQVIITETDDPNSWKRIFGNRVILIPMQANIKAGVDISKITNIRFDGDIVHIVLPAPVIEIESTTILNESVASEVSPFRHNFSEQEKAILARQGRNKIIRALPNLDIVRPAQEHAKQVLTGMTKALGYTAQIEMKDYKSNEIAQLVKK